MSGILGQVLNREASGRVPQTGRVPLWVCQREAFRGGLQNGESKGSRPWQGEAFDVKTKANHQLDGVYGEFSFQFSFPAYPDRKSSKRTCCPSGSDSLPAPLGARPRTFGETAPDAKGTEVSLARPFTWLTLGLGSKTIPNFSS